MWKKAEIHLLSSNDVQSAPGSDRNAKMAASRSGASPQFAGVIWPLGVSKKQSAVELFENLLTHFGGSRSEWGVAIVLQWYTGSGQEHNITQLAQAGLPAGRG